MTLGCCGPRAGLRVPLRLEPVGAEVPNTICEIGSKAVFKRRDLTADTPILTWSSRAT